MDFIQNLSDTELVEHLLANDEEAILYFFYKKFYSVFEYHVYRIFPYEVNVQELVHEFFLYLYENDWKHLRSYDCNKAKLSTWVSIVSLRFLVNYKKTKIDYNGRITIYEQWDNKIMQYKQDCQDQVKMDVTKAINSLKNKTERSVAQRLLIDDADIQEVASEHQLTVDYTYTVKSRAIAHLRKLLKAYRS